MTMPILGFDLHSRDCKYEVPETYIYICIYIEREREGERERETYLQVHRYFNTWVFIN